jgi:hypothetical protein
MGMLWELSTIFLNNRWFLLEYGKKGTTLFVVNGFVLVLVFTVIRVIVGCPYSYIFWSQLSVLASPSQTPMSAVEAYIWNGSEALG